MKIYKHNTRNTLYAFFGKSKEGGDIIYTAPVRCKQDFLKGVREHMKKGFKTVKVPEKWKKYMKLSDYMVQ
ncbi:MAG: hypothetical protein GY861_03100 [bacterium]|nr:hypothetical protein [bacterium]